MSALSVSPAVMINRLVLQDADSTTPHLAKVARLRMDLMAAADAEQAKRAALDPAAAAKPVNLDDAGVILDLLA